MLHRAFTTIVAIFVLQSFAVGQTIYSTDFDDLDVGFTENPANDGHDGWTSIFHPGNSFGEIQNTVSNGGNAIHQFTDISNTNAQQSIDNRSFAAVNTDQIAEIIFDVDFLASSSDLSTQNSYSASATIAGDGQLFSFSIGSGNGPVRSDVGVTVGLSTFNGTDNNIPFNPSVGQNLAWDQWHGVELRANLIDQEWISVTVNGNVESLEGIALPRNFGADGPFDPTFIDEIALQVVNIENFGDETSDSIFFDNLSLSFVAVPEPSAVAILSLAFVCLSTRRKRAKHAANQR